MQRQVTNIIKHMADSQQEMAKILEAKRHIAVRMAQIVHDIPELNPSFDDIDMLTENSMNVSKNIAAYLSSLADLEDALADNLAFVMKEVDIPDGEE
ncbi:MULTISPECIES: nucleoside-diphosphate sugar epimerase [Paenibacillus]|uniref:Nucleoside-diphosphate sugar epimerase n=1 Tax=Paenibacillus radicis (ex Xue et al. 2023) TaxID=2972489 RepID=A0ABT1Y920_9BACL|nr:nucleoside-diphosphate sugar epimerase [Paenibacillus radicis (ex Xue et al. 2023)]MCR8629687.1 nucleoside-diphosphate sugar epimerase [Paenibacillus radicis (ex Xue et al. 2023)]